MSIVDYQQVDAQALALALLLEADPCENNIARYLASSWCFAAKHEGRVVGACVVQNKGKRQAELMNIAVYPSHQRKGIGGALLQFSLQAVAQAGVSYIEVGTGCFGYQLAFYQRVGFRVTHVVKDHFLRHYRAPIFEFGIQHKDMLRLSMHLGAKNVSA